MVITEAHCAHRTSMAPSIPSAWGTMLGLPLREDEVAGPFFCVEGELPPQGVAPFFVDGFAREASTNTFQFRGPLKGRVSWTASYAAKASTAAQAL